MGVEMTKPIEEEINGQPAEAAPAQAIVERHKRTPRHIGISGTEARRMLGVQPDASPHVEINLRIEVGDDVCDCLKERRLEDNDHASRGAAELVRAFGSRDRALAVVEQALG